MGRKLGKVFSAADGHSKVISISVQKSGILISVLIAQTVYLLLFCNFADSSTETRSESVDDEFPDWQRADAASLSSTSSSRCRKQAPHRLQCRQRNLQLK